MAGNGTNGNGNDDRTALWRMVAVGLAGFVLSGVAGFMVFGLDSVKRSEMQGILDTRAPWIYDKVRVEEKIRDNTRRIDELYVMKERIDRKETPLSKDVEQLRDKVDKLQQAVWDLQTQQRNHPNP